MKRGQLFWKIVFDIIRSFNAKIRALSGADIKIYDIENPEWHLSEITYDKDKDRFFFKTDCKE